MQKTDIKALLSTAWIFAILNVIFRDIHELFRPGYLQEIMTGVVNGNKMTEGLLLVAGIAVEISIAMVLLSRVLPYHYNRPANIIIAPLTILSLFANGINDLDDMWFLGIATVTLIFIMWTAWQWKEQETVERTAIAQA